MSQYLAPGVYVEEVASAVQPIAGVGTSTAGFIGVVPDNVVVPVANPDFDPTQPVSATNSPALSGDDQRFTIGAAPGEVRLCTNFSEFTRTFDGFSTNVDQRKLAHAVFGFFDNGGTRCYVTRITDDTQLDKNALKAFDAIDEIAIVAFPGVTVTAAKADKAAVIARAELLQDRIAVLDGIQTTEFTKEKIQDTGDSSHAAIYFPWIKVFDPVEKLAHPQGDGMVIVPPSGHIAGVYARVDGERGVHKAPANEVIRGALDLEVRLSKADQDGLNPKGVNVIRAFDGKIMIWGARTMGGDANGDFKYVSTRRYFDFLRKSIYQGTQFVVFEPNSPALWKRIIRSVGDFLLGQWRDGALFGETPKQAFFVKCDAETNPPDVRARGQVVTEIGVAIVQPAEFVIFRIQQETGT